jgi:6-phosphogluconolactonase (cycloisomerase 2 family)
VAAVLAPVALPSVAQAAGSAYVANIGDETVSQFAIFPNGSLTPMSPASVAGDNGPTGIALSPDGKSLYVSNSAESTVSQYTVDPATGALSPKTPASVASGAGPRHEGIAVTPDGKSAYVTNLNDNSVSQYDVEPLTGTLSAKSPATVAAGSGPNGIAVTPDGKSAYVANLNEGTVSQYDIDPLTGAMSPKAPASVAAGTSPAGVAVTPDGKSVYVKNAGTISQYDVSPANGTLSPKSPATVASGAASGTNDTTPIAVAPDGKSAYVTNESAAEPTILQYDIDPETGVLSPKTPASVATATQPSNLAVAPDGKSVYVTNTFSEAVSQYSVDPLSGALMAKTPTSVGSGMVPLGIAVGAFPLAHPTTTSLSCSPSTVVAAHSTTCTASITDASSSGQTTPSGTVSFTSEGPGSFEGGASCTLKKTSLGAASCAVSYVPGPTAATPVRSDALSATYAGDPTHGESTGSASVKVLSITLLAQGSFVIGDQNAEVGSSVTFWGAQWAKQNALSGAKAPTAFKGFAATTSANPPTCAAVWSTASGNSPPPPAGPLPAYMAIIASSSIGKSGSTIFAGNTVHVVVVKTNPGYASDPEHPGTGTVVGTVC